MSDSHQRRSSNIKTSFHYDIEKISESTEDAQNDGSGLLFDTDAKSQTGHSQSQARRRTFQRFFSVAFSFLVVITFINFIYYTAKQGSKSISSQASLKSGSSLLESERELLSRLESDKIVSPVNAKSANTGNNVMNFDESQGLTPQIDELVNAEIQKQQQSDIGTVSDPEEDDEELEADDSVRSQNDLKEIFAVNPVIILSSDPSSPKQKQLETILMNINIHPEPKVVNLFKHPNYESILKYLKHYESYTTIPTGTTGTIKNNLVYASHEDDADSEEQSAVDDIPRLFVGGSPYGNYKSIFTLYKNNNLQSYLRERGRGTITIG
ncbi:uncharacterized protein RJT20DRAFT_134622 [Scheffersomyces xylosifermentans]|uniref:uncharacterized protein n=1 Tax=Scheffersomyces xylosifermentans TaxID=1304137 RepID=UPI00315DF7C4